ncbi:MAG: hypothetical protein L0Y80_08300 [Ignavibacteriae bacterium]|nr:hypothetical protein [Ignavibacteriota bacterium]
MYKRVQNYLSKTALIGIAVLCYTAALAQQVRIIELPQLLPLPPASIAKISPTGAYISFSGEKFNGLFVTDSRGMVITELSPYAGIGWGHTWSPDGRLIAARANHPEQQTKRVSLEVFYVFSKRSASATGLLDSRARLSLPHWSSANILVFSTNEGVVLRKAQIGDSAVTILTPNPAEVSFKRWTSSALETHQQATTQYTQPFRETREVLNNDWSPDGKRSAVEFSGRPSLYMVTDDGKTSNLLDPKGEYPAWINNQYLVYMVTEDDGYRITSGTIWISDAEGKMKMNLTEGLNEIALYPSAAQDGTIVFTTESGAVYKMKVAVE